MPRFPGAAGRAAPFLLGAIAALLLVFWGALAWWAYRTTGLFVWLGFDFGYFWAVTRAGLTGGPAASYDVAAIAAASQALVPYFGGDGGRPLVVPPPWPPVFFLLLVPFAVLPPPAGFLLWTLLNLVVALLVVGGWAGRAGARRLALPVGLLALAFYAVPDTLFFGQPSILGLLAIDRGQRAFAQGRDFRAGLWTGLLLIKPQYAAFLVLVLLGKRRWRAVAGVAAVALFLAGSSLLLLGRDGFPAYAAAVLDLARFRVAEPLIAPTLMISWRGVLLNLLPAATPDGLGVALALALSAATALALWPLWRGPWAAGEPRFDRQLLATMLVTMLASYHNHAHGATLLVAPALAVLAGRSAGPLLGALLFLAVLVPNAIFFATLNGVWVAGSLVGLMAAALAVLLIRERRPAAAYAGDAPGAKRGPGGTGRRRRGWAPAPRARRAVGTRRRRRPRPRPRRRRRTSARRRPAP